MYRHIVKMKHDSSPTQSPSLCVAQSRYRVSDIVRKVVCIHLHTIGQNIDEELADSTEEYRQHCLLVIVGRARNNLGIIPRGNRSCPFMIGIKRLGFVRCVQEMESCRFVRSKNLQHRFNILHTFSFLIDCERV
jgi:hypothetical protein